MLPSSTVENYLKAIYQGQSTLPSEQRLLPMGHVAAAVGVTPGTATTMVKALAESGLAVTTANDMADGARRVVALAAGNTGKAA